MNRLSQTETEIIESDTPPLDWLLSPIVNTGSAILIHAAPGVGKTFFAMWLAGAIAGGGKFLDWTAPRPRPVGVVDSELGKVLMKSRIEELVEFIEAEIPIGNTRYLVPEMCPGFVVPRISEPEGQAFYDAEFADRDCLVFDNYVGLTTQRPRENDEQVWRRTHEWLVRLKASRKAVILVHHTGKGGAQLGTSMKEQYVDWVLKLTKPFDYLPAQGVRFELTFEKTRVDPRICAPEPLSVEMKLDGGQVRWEWKPLREEKARIARDMKKANMNDRDIASGLGISVFEVKKALDEAMWGKA